MLLVFCHLCRDFYLQCCSFYWCAFGTLQHSWPPHLGRASGSVLGPPLSLLSHSEGTPCRDLKFIHPALTHHGSAHHTQISKCLLTGLPECLGTAPAYLAQNGADSRRGTHICLANDTLRSNQTQAAYAHLLIPSHLSVNLLGILILLPPIFIPNITIFHHLYYFTPNPRHPNLPPRLGHGSPLVFLPHSPSWPQPAFTLHRALVTRCINQIPTPAVKPSRGSQPHSRLHTGPWSMRSGPPPLSFLSLCCSMHAHRPLASSGLSQGLFPIRGLCTGCPSCCECSLSWSMQDYAFCSLKPHLKCVSPQPRDSLWVVTVLTFIKNKNAAGTWHRETGPQVVYPIKMLAPCGHPGLLGQPFCFLISVLQLSPQLSSDVSLGGLTGTGHPGGKRRKGYRGKS